MMKALRVTRHARPSEALRWEEVAVPEPGPAQVLIRVSAASLNFNDIDRCYGRRVTVPTPPPFTLGMDVCGTVTATGPGAESWLGQRVVAITQMAQGGLAEYAIAPTDSVFVAPPKLDDAEATGFVIPFHTAYLALIERGRLVAGESVLVHSGASGVGSAAIQLSLAAGARVFTTVGGPEKLALCQELGVELALDHREQSWSDIILDHTEDHGADVVFDLAGGDFVGQSWRCVAHGGRYLCVGFSDDPDNGMSGRPLRPLCMGNFSIVGTMAAYMSTLPSPIRRVGLNPFGRDTAERVHARLLDLLEQGAIRPIIGRRLRPGEAAQALEDHEARRTQGRSVVLIGDDM